MPYLLDTDTCNYAIRGAFAPLDSRLAAAKPSDIAISAVTRAELVFGLEKRRRPRPLSSLVYDFLDRVQVLAWDAAAADAFARLRAALERAGAPIGIMDTMIAGHALSLRATLVTNNQRHFRKVPKLEVENWTLP